MYIYHFLMTHHTWIIHIWCSQDYTFWVHIFYKCFSFPNWKSSPHGAFCIFSCNADLSPSTIMVREWPTTRRLGQHICRRTLQTSSDDWTIAPSELLDIIKCNCLQNGSTKSCTCKKFNLFCSVACGHCRGIACCNRQPSESSDVED